MKASELIEDMVTLPNGRFSITDAQRVTLLNLVRSLEDDRIWLGCLESAGVDNWGGFEYAQELYAGDAD